MQDLIAVKRNYCIVHTSLWKHISTKYGDLQTKNIKYIKRTVYNCIKRY